MSGRSESTQTVSFRSFIIAIVPTGDSGPRHDRGALLLHCQRCGLFLLREPCSNARHAAEVAKVLSHESRHVVVPHLDHDRLAARQRRPMHLLQSSKQEKGQQRQQEPQSNSDNHVENNSVYVNNKRTSAASMGFKTSRDRLKRSQTTAQKRRRRRTLSVA